MEVIEAAGWVVDLETSEQGIIVSHPLTSLLFEMATLVMLADELVLLCCSAL